MAEKIELPVYEDVNGNLAVIQDACPFNIKRVFYIFNVGRDDVRGEHGHVKSRVLITCPIGQCTLYYNNGKLKEEILLDNANKAVLLEPEDWHKLYNFSEHSVALVLSSENYDKKDYFFEEPNS